jgi:hypothetical protein
MALARFLTRWEDVPHEPGERFQFRMPNWVTIEEARAERTRNLYKTMRETREVVGAELLAEWRQQNEDAKAKTDAEAAKRGEDSTALTQARTAEEILNDYDQLLLLKAGIGAWTYCEPQRDADGNPRVDRDGKLIPDRSKPIPVTSEAIRDLDEATRQWAGLTLVALIGSGFRPVMPEVVMDDRGDVIEVRPGCDDAPFGSRFSSDGTLTATRA